jgi:hypothetical protein
MDLGDDEADADAGKVSSAGLQSNLASPRTVLNKVRLGASGPVGFVGFMVLNREARKIFRADIPKQCGSITAHTYR